MKIPLKPDYYIHSNPPKLRLLKLRFMSNWFLGESFIYHVNKKRRYRYNIKKEKQINKKKRWKTRRLINPAKKMNTKFKVLNEWKNV